LAAWQRLQKGEAVEAVAREVLAKAVIEKLDDTDAPTQPCR